MKHSTILLQIGNPPQMQKKRRQHTIEGFFLFKALCKKIMESTNVVAQDHSLIAGSGNLLLNNGSRAFPPNWVVSGNIVTAQETLAIRPKCEFVVSNI